MKEGHGLNLERALEVVENCENCSSQLAAISTTKEGVDSVNILTRKNNARAQIIKSRNSQKTKRVTNALNLVLLQKIPSLLLEERAVGNAGSKITLKKM